MTSVDTGRLATIGSAAPALILNAHAEVIDLVIVMRTGNNEYLISTSPATTCEVEEWLRAHSAIADDRGPVFAGLEVSDESASLAAVAIHGTEASEILTELFGSSPDLLLCSSALTTATIGRLDVMLFAWPLLRSAQPSTQADALVASTQPDNARADALVYELIVPAGALPALTDILLGFSELDPEDFEQYRHRRKAAHTWFLAAEQPGYIKPDTPELVALLRPERDFVGARALAAQNALS
jgi:glycine cleavage system aminomethyltransferase T